MKKRVIALMCALLLLVPVFAGCSQSGNSSEAKSITVVDDTGREVTIPQPLEKVVVANRYNSELIRGIGAIDKVVAVDKNTAQDRVYWSQFDPDNVIGKGQSELNYEKIAELGAQVLITPDNGTWEEDIKKLEPFGIQVVVVSGYNNAELPKEIEILGKLFGKEKEAEKLTKFYQDNMDMVAEKIKDVKGTKKVYWEYGDPNTTCIPGTSNDGWNSMLLNAGAVNIFGDPTITGKTIDPEKILLEDPDLIIKTSSGPALKNTGVYTPPTAEDYSTISTEMLSRAGWSDLKAVQNDDFYVTTGFCAGGLGKMIGTAYTAKWLYPEQMKDVDPDAIFDEWMEIQGVDPVEGHVFQVKHQ